MKAVVFLVSIIVPVYNCEHTLKRCVQSILEQSYKNIELILVDDGSRDSSPDLCDEIAKNDSRAVVIHKQNGGASSARNCGLDVAKGKYIQFVDSDDYIDGNMTEKLVNLIENNNVQLSVCGFIYTHPNYEEYARFPDIPSVSVKEMSSVIPNFVSSYFPNALWNKLYLRDYIDFRFNENVRVGEDLIFNLNYFRKISAISVSSICPLHYVVDNPESLTGKIKLSRISDTLAFYKECFSFYKEFGCEENIKQISNSCANTILYATLKILASRDFSENDKKNIVKNVLSDTAASQIFKNCYKLSFKQRILAFYVKKRNYLVLKFFAMITQKEK